MSETTKVSEEVKIVDPKFRVGRIRVVKRQRGFGFVREGGNDYFFHMTSFLDEEEFWTSETGDKLNFNLIESKEGKIQAGNCSIVKEVK